MKVTEMGCDVRAMFRCIAWRAALNPEAAHKINFSSFYAQCHAHRRRDFIFTKGITVTYSPSVPYLIASYRRFVVTLTMACDEEDDALCDVLFEEEVLEAWQPAYLLDTPRYKEGYINLIKFYVENPTV